ncbi:phosphotransferase family protein [Nocardioides sp.]|uniref:phosphotransferase family protein n=1 Tax=Nocardioides sp. TaxID=35761 RepID=UPI00260947B2|nr:phosphotransferase family protein [Nocardioides sp.]
MDRIEQLERRYPTEPEFEWLMRRRAAERLNGPYVRPSLNELAGMLREYFRATVDPSCEVLDPHWFVGGASKVQVGFTLEQHDHSTRRLVMRMEPGESLNVTSRTREFELMNALRGTVPVPNAPWVDATGDWFPQPVLITEFCAGVAKPSRSASGQVTGLGTRFGPDLAADLAPQFMSHLAAIHTFDHSASSLPSFARPHDGAHEAALWQLNRALRVWEEDRDETIPLMEVAARWLRDHVPSVDHVSVVHGDFRSGNFLFDEDSRQITAWLDWERGHLGDRHRDLAWTIQAPFGHYDEEGDYLVCGLVKKREFFDWYTDVSGLSVDEERLRYYTILNCFQIIAALHGTGFQVVKHGKSHQDILLARLKGEVGIIAEDLRRELLEVL